MRSIVINYTCWLVLFRFSFLITNSFAENKVISELKSINFNNDKLIINKGFFNEESKINMKLPKTVSFAFLDFDFYQPTLDGLNYLNNVLNVGGIMVSRNTC